MARAFARERARVFLAGRTLPKLNAVANEISAAGGVVETVQVNSLDEEDVETYLDGVIARVGGIDILFNSIGMEDIQGTLLVDMRLEDFMHPIITAARTQLLVVGESQVRTIEGLGR